MHALDALGTRGGALGRLVGVSCDLEAGMHVVVGTPADGLAALWAVLVGAARPMRGILLVGGRAPWSSAPVRRGIASLGPAPCLLGRRVRDAAQVSPHPDALLEGLVRFGLGAQREREVDRLSTSEQRAVELVFAVSHPTPELVVLYEPSTLVGALDPVLVREALQERATRIPVVILASAPADAHGLAVTPRFLDGGRLVPPEIAEGWLRATAYGLEVVLWDPDGDRAAALLYELAKRAVPHGGASWHASEGEPRLRRVRIESQAIDEVAHAVTAIGAELNLDVRLIARRSAQASHEVTSPSGGSR
ncbi:MAG: hypothetical protein FJ095_03735 [Deltaproteobacteria bacterium]|nr:hypothetical protein [Deltaproteobacteria bacterium]